MPVNVAGTLPVVVPAWLTTVNWLSFVRTPPPVDTSAAGGRSDVEHELLVDRVALAVHVKPARAADADDDIGDLVRAGGAGVPQHVGIVTADVIADGDFAARDRLGGARLVQQQRALIDDRVAAVAVRGRAGEFDGAQAVLHEIGTLLRRVTVEDAGERELGAVFGEEVGGGIGDHNTALPGVVAGQVPQVAGADGALIGVAEGMRDGVVDDPGAAERQRFARTVPVDRDGGGGAAGARRAQLGNIKPCQVAAEGDDVVAGRTGHRHRTAEAGQGGQVVQSGLDVGQRLVVGAARPWWCRCRSA